MNKVAVVILVASCGCFSRVVGVPLPGERDTRPALAPTPFPDRLSAYVWRNWGLVRTERLAAVVGATPDELTAVACDMGLPPNPIVVPEWRRKGYVTIVRRNWHLLPYDQLLTLLDMSRDEFAFRLKEDDFLFTKLGGVKPFCEPLTYSAQAASIACDARRQIGRIVREEGLDDFSEEPRFAFIRELSALPSHNGADSARAPHDAPFDFRLIFSYFAEYGDPLADPEIGSFPEGLLQRLSRDGVNAVWLHAVLRTLVKDPKYPEFGAGCENRIANLRKLVARCAKYGIKVYLYMNEPRGLERAFFDKPGREDMRGVMRGHGVCALCTSCPETLRWLRESLRSVFSQVRGLGGIFTITMSENTTSCASNGGKSACPRCRGRLDGEIIAEVNAAMIEGMAAGDPSAEAIVWTWAWPAADVPAIIARLPRRNCRVMAVSEHDMPISRGGMRARVDDYSISVVGPGDAALEAWRAAASNGLGTVAKVQANCSWELSSFPYLPVMDLVARHAVNLATNGVTGVMLSWSCGCAPAPNLRVWNELRRGEKTPDPVLDRLAASLYGARAVPGVRAAWTAFSNAFVEYPFDCVTLYFGPQQWGPANPLYLHATGWRATMVGIPYDDFTASDEDHRWRAKCPEAVWIAQFDKVAAGFEEGCRLFSSVLPLTDDAHRNEAARELGMFRAQAMHFASAADQARFILARDRGDRAEMLRLLRRECDRAKAYLPLVRADSRIGYECSNHYFFVPNDLREKVVLCRLMERGNLSRAAN